MYMYPEYEINILLLLLHQRVWNHFSRLFDYTKDVKYNLLDYTIFSPSHFPTQRSLLPRSQSETSQEASLAWKMLLPCIFTSFLLSTF